MVKRIVMKRNTSNIPEYFFDKEFCDAIRDIAMNSLANIEEAEMYMKVSKDYKRDSMIVKKLSNVGISRRGIMPVIKAMNSE